jgi:choline monooxygenase
MSGFTIDADIAKAKTLSTDFYTSSNYFEEAKEKIFGNSWQFIGSSELVKIPGSCYPFKLLKYYLDEPLLLTRDQQDQLHC